MNILCIGDIVGSDSVNYVSGILNNLRSRFKIDFCIANGENTANNGRGISKYAFDKLSSNGVDFFTMGNHVWSNNDIYNILDKKNNIIIPANILCKEKNKEYGLVEVNGAKICIINLLGRAFMDDAECPFKTTDNILKKLDKNINIIVIDFHAEATSEKAAFKCYLDGRVSAVFGTHTHVQTADERISENGTAYITDIGMTGPLDSVLGIDKRIIINRFVNESRERFRVANGNIQFNGIILNINKKTGKTTKISRILL